MRCGAVQQPCTFFLCEPTLLQRGFVRMQTRFAPYNTMSYACKHVLHRCNTISYAYKHVLRLATRFRMRTNTFYIVAANDLVVNMSCCALQQTIRGSI